MFTFSPRPFLYGQDVPRLAIGGHGKVYSVAKDGVSYLELETAPDAWNPFNEACLFQQFFCVGSGDRAYFVDLQTQEIKTVLCEMYFGGFYVRGNRLYVASNSRLSCFDDHCQLLWQTGEIAVDGVRVDGFSEDALWVSCEMDPPGGWVLYQVSACDGTVRATKI